MYTCISIILHHYHGGKPNRRLALNTVPPAKNRRLLLGVDVLPKCCHGNVGQAVVFLSKMSSFRGRGLFPTSSRLGFPPW